MAKQKTEIPAGMRKALDEYGRLIKRKGWQAGEKLVARYRKKYKDFDKWACALSVMLRADELLKEGGRKKPKRWVRCAIKAGTGKTVLRCWGRRGHKGWHTAAWGKK